ncbi:MAG: hypothetical protein HOP09_07080 [Hyphomicrobium sp.]|nr:hypothetical protein [Hyphomicrobium sp.]
MKRILLGLGLVLAMSMPATAQTNDQTATQTGNGNEATVTQLQPTNSNDNDSLIEQGTSLAPSDNNKATVYQGGASWDLTPQDAKNDSKIWQKQDGNEAIVKQTGTLGVTNTSEIDTDGNDSYASVDQQGRGTGPNFSRIDQVGDDNRATVTQLDVYNDNNSDIDQNGSNNTANVYQGEAANFAGGPGANKYNHSEVTQTGDWSRAEIDQEGNENASVNTSLVTQNGTGVGVGQENLVSVHQYGSTTNFSSANQNGNSNTATVNQH